MEKAFPIATGANPAVDDLTAARPAIPLHPALRAQDKTRV